MFKFNCCHRERDPEIREILRSLFRAKADLQAGKHDLNGHRTQAVLLIDQAIKTVRQGLQQQLE